MNINEIFQDLPQWGIEEITGYKPCTTFWQDFSIADHFVINGIEPDAIIDTHNRAWPQLQDGFLGIEGLTEYIMVLNWKIHDHYDTHREIAKVYNNLWAECDEWAVNNLKGEKLTYYLDTTD